MDWRTYQINRAIDELPRRQRLIVRRNVFANYKVKSLAKLFKVSSARICQLRRKAFNTLDKVLIRRLGLKRLPVEIRD